MGRFLGIWLKDWHVLTYCPCCSISFWHDAQVVFHIRKGNSVEGLAWLHILLLSCHLFWTSCPSCLPHQKRLFSAFTLIAIDEWLIPQHGQFYVGYSIVWIMGWWVLWGFLTFNTKVRSWCKLTLFRNMKVNMISLSWYESQIGHDVQNTWHDNSTVWSHASPSTLQSPTANRLLVM